MGVIAKVRVCSSPTLWSRAGLVIASQCLLEAFLNTQERSMGATCTSYATDILPLGQSGIMTPCSCRDNLKPLAARIMLLKSLLEAN